MKTGIVGVRSDALNYLELRILANKVFKEVIGAAGYLMLGIEDESWLNRSCAYWCLKAADGENTLGMLLGGLGGNYDRREAYALKAEEKISRLELMLDDETAEVRHLTSWESRNHEEGKYGGAVVLPIGGTEYIFSLSALPEAGDEAFNLILAEAYRPNDHALAARTMEILNRTQNPYYDRLRSQVFGLNRC